MSLVTPDNEAEIFSTLNEAIQKDYLKKKTGAEKAASKHPEYAAIYSDYLSTYLKHAKEYNFAVKNESGLRLHPSDIEKEMKKMDTAIAREFDQEYPIFTPDNASDADKATAARNKHAVQLLREEIEGPGIIKSVVKTVYDEERGGMQWKGIAGIAIGGLLGGFMGNYIAGAAGPNAGWMGMVATVLLAGAGAVLGSRIANKINPPAPETTSPEVQGLGKVKDLDKTLEHARQKLLDGQPTLSKEAQLSYDTLERVFKDAKTVSEKTPEEQEKALTRITEAHTQKLVEHFKKDNNVTPQEEKAAAVYGEALMEAGLVSAPPPTPTTPETAAQQKR